MSTSNANFALLKQSKYFKELNDSQLTRILALSKEVQFKKNEYIFNEGDTPNIFYFIVEGEVEISKKDSNKNISYKIAALKNHSLIGEGGFITHHKRNASIIASTDVIALAFPIDAFRAKEYSDIFLLLNHNVSEQLVTRIDNSYKLIADSVRAELQKSHKLKFYQFIIIIIMAIFLFQLALALQYLMGSTGLCSDVNKIKQQMQPAASFLQR